MTEADLQAALDAADRLDPVTNDELLRDEAADLLCKLGHLEKGRIYGVLVQRGPEVPGGFRVLHEDGGKAGRFGSILPVIRRLRRARLERRWREELAQAPG